MNGKWLFLKLYYKEGAKFSIIVCLRSFPEEMLNASGLQCSACLQTCACCWYLSWLILVHVCTASAFIFICIYVHSIFGLQSIKYSLVISLQMLSPDLSDRNFDFVAYYVVIIKRWLFIDVGICSIRFSYINIRYRRHSILLDYKRLTRYEQETT